MADIASRHGISTLGITLQYKVNFKTVNRTIAMIRLKSSHTGSLIEKLVKQALLEYNIPLSRIYGITTDNGANMLKAAKDMNKTLDLSRLGLEDVPVNTEEDSCDSYGELIELHGGNGNSEEGEREDEDQILLDQRNESVLQDFSSIIFSGNLETVSIQSLLCGAHTLQLSVMYAIKQWDVETQMVSKCRSIATKLRAQNCRYLISQQGFQTATLDCTTRWNSTYEMVNKL